MADKIIRERDVEKHLRKRIKEIGGEIRKVQWIGRNGAPDRLVMAEFAAPHWVELKAPGEHPTPAQLREHKRMRRCGCKVDVIDSLAGVEALIYKLTGQYNRAEAVCKS